MTDASPVSHAACLTAALATAWGALPTAAQAQSERVDFDIDATLDLTDSVLVYSEGFSDRAFFSVGQLDAGQSRRVSVDVGLEPNTNEGFYLFAATYETGFGTGVAISFPDATPALGAFFEELFAAPGDGLDDIFQSDIVNSFAMDLEDTTDINNLVDNLFTEFFDGRSATAPFPLDIDTTSALVAFDPVTPIARGGGGGGFEIGTVTVPAPAGALALIPLAGGVLRRRRG